MEVWQRWWFWVAVAVLAAAIALTVGLRSSLQIASETDRALETVAQLNDNKDRITVYRELAQYQVDGQVKIWTAIVQALGAVVIGVGGYVTWRNFRVAQDNHRIGQENLQVAQENLRATQDKLDIDRQGQITNRFTQAVAQLGAELKNGPPNLEVRLGGIYALERIAQDSPDYHWTIMEILTTYVRQNAPWSSPPLPSETHDEMVNRLVHGRVETPPSPIWFDERKMPEPPSRPRIDIQAIMTVLGRRDSGGVRHEPRPLNLSRTDLEGVDIPGANLAGANLQGSNLGWATLTQVNLRGANLERATLDWANLDRGDLREAKLVGVSMKGANLPFAHMEDAWLEDVHMAQVTLRGAHLEGAKIFQVSAPWALMIGAHLNGASLGGTNLICAQLGGADLTGAVLMGAQLNGADLNDANLTDARLDGARCQGATGLTREQVLKAHEGWQGADLPPELMDVEASAASDPSAGEQLTRSDGADGESSRDVSATE